jgi:hypothetical protein
MAQDDSDEPKCAGGRLDKLVLMKLLTKVNLTPKLLDRIAPAEDCLRESKDQRPYPTNLQEKHVPDNKRDPKDE